MYQKTGILPSIMLWWTKGDSKCRENLKECFSSYEIFSFNLPKHFTLMKTFISEQFPVTFGVDLEESASARYMQ